MSEMVLYSDKDGNIRVSVVFSDETFWMNQNALAELFKVSKQSVSYHLNNIFNDNELEQKLVVKEILTTASDGKTYQVLHYNLDAIIAVGYRINSKKATQFRIWATQTLKEFITKGFVLNDEMLKNGRPFGKDYFDELLERIREIRASERRFYQKITDIYAQCSYDYSKDAEETTHFFKTVQNKLLFAIKGNTAPALIVARVHSSKPHMGLTAWKNAPEGKILKSDITISKNLLTDRELSDLNRIVSMYLDYAENQAKRQIKMSMSDWRKKLDAFLQFNEYEILQHAEKVSREVANALAESEYKKFRPTQDRDFVSDFDKVAKKFCDTGKSNR